MTEAIDYEKQAEEAFQRVIQAQAYLAVSQSDQARAELEKAANDYNRAMALFLGGGKKRGPDNYVEDFGDEVGDAEAGDYQQQTWVPRYEGGV